MLCLYMSNTDIEKGRASIMIILRSLETVSQNTYSSQQVHSLSFSQKFFKLFIWGNLKDVTNKTLVIL